jgi:hypothetical protein
MTLFWILALVIVAVAVIAAGGFFAGPRTTHVIDRDVPRRLDRVDVDRVDVDMVDEVVDEPVATRRVVRRRYRA